MHIHLHIHYFFGHIFYNFCLKFDNVIAHAHIITHAYICQFSDLIKMKLLIFDNITKVCLRRIMVFSKYKNVCGSASRKSAYAFVRLSQLQNVIGNVLIKRLLNCRS